ncbi:MAG: hypothetical protein ACI88A_003593 [Paraglaciecola sp.]
MADQKHNTSYTESVMDMLNTIQSPRNAMGLYQEAQEYFHNVDSDKAEIAKLSEQISVLVGELSSASKEIHREHMVRLNSLEKQLKEEYSLQENKRLNRLSNALQVCLNIITISEGENYADTQHKSSKFLGSILLISPGQGAQLSELHQRMKPAYKAVLSLRLLDKLLLDKMTTNKHILEYYDAEQRYDVQNLFDSAFTHTVILPIMLAAMFQDIGLHHPELIAMQKGEGGKDLFRVLEPEERNYMLKLSHQYSLQYLHEGLGFQAYTGNSKAQRNEFELLEKKRLHFQTRLLQDAYSPELGIGDIIKIPQIYTSVVLSTKRDYLRKNLPTAAILIDQLGQKKSISGAAAKAFINIVGYFPQGYGICNIPTDLRGIELDSYEFCIVNQLNPANPQEPICRRVTRNLAYITSGESEAIKKTVNLHYPVARKKLIKIERVRLIQILEKLRYNFDPKEAHELIPEFWEPYEYFFVKKRQNLWTRASK